MRVKSGATVSGVPSEDWEAKLIYIQDLLEQWLAMQRTWLYLEPIFGAEDIVRQMPTEAHTYE